MLWNWSGFPLHLPYLFRRLPNTHFSKRCCDDKLSTLWWKSFLPRKLQGQSALASSVSNEPSGKKFQGFGGCRRKISRDSESQIFDSTFPQSENVSSSFLSFFRLPLGPTLINLRLSSVWHVFISLFQADTLLLFRILMWDFYLEVKQSPQKAETSEIVLAKLQNCHIRRTETAQVSSFSYFYGSRARAGTRKSCKQIWLKSSPKGYTVPTDYKRQTSRKNLFPQGFTGYFHIYSGLKFLLLPLFFEEVSVKWFW